MMELWRRLGSGWKFFWLGSVVVFIEAVCILAILVLVGKLLFEVFG